MRCFVVIFVLLLAVSAQRVSPYVFRVNGNMGSSVIALAYNQFSLPYAAVEEISMKLNTDALGGWWNLFVSGQAVPGGGILPQYFTYAFSRAGDHVVIIGQPPNNYGTVSVTSTLRFDSQGWVTLLWEFTNPSGAATTITLGNNGIDALGSDVYTAFYLTSDGNQVLGATDDWALTYDILEIGPVVGFSFGRGNLLQAQGIVSAYQEFWADDLVLGPYETQSLLEVIVVGYHTLSSLQLSDILNVKYQLHSVLTHERNFYNYVTADGYRILDHLSYNQLFSAANWNFLSAGIAGKLETDSESRVVRMDGSIEQINPEPGVYCLFEDQALQVNFRVSTSGVVDEIVVFAREHGMSFHASLELNGQPLFLINGHSVEIPMSRFDGNLVTESAPFKVPFTHIPLSALGEYHVNSLHFRDIFTVVGGLHPDLGGFFNVAVHRRESGNRFPGLLNVPFGSKLRDVGFGCAVVPDIWFDLSY